MKTQLLTKLLGLLAILMMCTMCAPTLVDLSPDRRNEVSDPGSSTGGLILNIDGDKNALYGVGLNSGVWKTQLNVAGGFDPWTQLSTSPRYAHCIAVDPVFPEHIAVGEREGDAKLTAQNKCGLWESFDGGKTFKEAHYFDPFSHPCGQNNNSQVVNGVVITNKSTVLISTPCGIGRKEYFAPTFTFANLTTSQNDQTFTGIATFKDWMVARTRTSIFISNDDGKTWKEHVIQLNFKGQDFRQEWTEGLFSVSIFVEPASNRVFVYIPVTRSQNGPCIKPDTGIDPCSGKASDPPTCNYGSFIVFNNENKQWSYQIIRERGLGTGLGGRVFMKSFFSQNANLQNRVGGNSNLIYSTAQNIMKAVRLHSDGTVVWEVIANANLCGEPEPSNFHADIWDFHLDPLGWYSWVGTDGGVYYIAKDRTQTTLNLNLDDEYLNLNEGLHTLHIHQAFVAGYPGTGPGEERYGFGSQDNGAWKNVTEDNVSKWEDIGLGDANIAEGDQGNPEFLLVGRNLQTALLTGLQSAGSPVPAGAKLGPTTIAYGNSGSFQFIQTLASESLHLMLDAVMLTELPLKYNTGGNIINVPGGLGSTSGMVIVRNTAFAKEPDINISKGAGWNIEFSELPDGPQAFWVSGGHADPTYFLICLQSGNTLLFLRKKSQSSWTPLPMPAGKQIIPYVPGHVQHGPVFVNPYNPLEIYVSCSDGVYRGQIAVGGWVFDKDIELTSLISANGKYPLNWIFPGGNGMNVVKSNQSNLNSMYPLSWLSANRYDPKQIVAASPYTGVFFKDGSAKWKDLSRVLPKPFTPVSSVNINNQGIYVTTEGRGMFKIQNY